MGVTVKGHIVIPAEQVEALRPALLEHRRLTLAEPGCLKFEVTESPERPGHFQLSEAFVDAAAFRAHQARTAASDWARLSAGLERQFSVSGLNE